MSTQPHKEPLYLSVQVQTPAVPNRVLDGLRSAMPVPYGRESITFLAQLHKQVTAPYTADRPTRLSKIATIQLLQAMYGEKRAQQLTTRVLPPSTTPHTLYVDVRRSLDETMNGTELVLSVQCTDVELHTTRQAACAYFERWAQKEETSDVRTLRQRLHHHNRIAHLFPQSTAYVSQSLPSSLHAVTQAKESLANEAQLCAVHYGVNLIRAATQLFGAPIEKHAHTSFTVSVPFTGEPASTVGESVLEKLVAIPHEEVDSDDWEVLQEQILRSFAERFAQ